MYSLKNIIFYIKDKIIKHKIKILELEHENFTEFTDKNYVKDETKYSKYYIPWAYNNYKDWLPEYQEEAMLLGIMKSENEVFDTFAFYCGYGYKLLTSEQIKIMDSELEKEVSFIKDNIVLYRMDIYKKLCERCNVDYIKKGMVLKIPGFYGTGLIKKNLMDNEEYKYCDTIIKLFAPKGTNGLYVNLISHRSEEEIILSRNQEIKILYLTHNGQKKFIFAEIKQKRKIM